MTRGDATYILSLFLLLVFYISMCTGSITKRLDRLIDLCDYEEVEPVEFIITIDPNEVKVL